MALSESNQLSDMVVSGNGQVVDLVSGLLTRGAQASDILEQGLLPGMDIVGQHMKTGKMFIPEVLLSARVMASCLEILEPVLVAEQHSSLGTVVIGTVEGDVHDIGKNIVAMMLQGSGFKVVNLGINVKAQNFVDAAKTNDAVIVAMSALLTTTMPRMTDVVAALKAAGLRDRIKVLIGGPSVNRRFADEIGADGYGNNASFAVDKARELVTSSVH